MLILLHRLITRPGETTTVDQEVERLAVTTAELGTVEGDLDSGAVTVKHASKKKPKP